MLTRHADLSPMEHVLCARQCDDKGLGHPSPHRTSCFHWPKFLN